MVRAEATAVRSLRVLLSASAAADLAAEGSRQSVQWQLHWQSQVHSEPGSLVGSQSHWWLCSSHGVEQQVVVVGEG